MRSYIIDSIVRTILYADIFDYPLTSYEIWKWLIASKGKITFTDIASALGDKKTTGKSGLFNIIEEKEGYYFLKNKKKLVTLRKNRSSCSEAKIKLAQKYTFLLRFFPCIKLVGISGGLAIKNADENDDIDLFIITQHEFIWVARFISIIIMELLRVRRKPSSDSVKNLVCLNMFMDESSLSLLPNERDMFSAHEVVQMYPIWSRGTIYNTFLYKNRWVQQYLLHVLPTVVVKNDMKTVNYRKSIFANPFSILQFLLKKIQIWHMQKRITTESISDTMLRFHPHDVRMKVLQEYQARMKKYHLN